ncbi:MAG: accessory factor UbiK family protein, partial [Gammaproteobacteria bacterium]|nr:accessory factor UbiK family protein [Gammaproteobacteria bacterium]
MDTKTLDDLARRLAEAVPQGVRELQHDLEKNFRGVLQGAFDRMDLVTREEFEVQREVLARTRAKVEALEARVGALEAQ